MKADEVTRIAAQLITRGGVRLSDEDLRLLESNASVLTSGQEDRADVMSTAALRGFFDAAADGDALVPLYLIQEQFGRTLEEDYPEAGEAFLRFARTYWSLKIVLDTSSESNWAHQALLYIEARIIGPLFFPFPGPFTVVPVRRESDQRDLLRQYGKRIDIEDFIRHNPILIRDKAGKKGGGCLGVLACAIGMLVFLTYLALRLSSK